MNDEKITKVNAEMVDNTSKAQTVGASSKRTTINFILIASILILIFLALVFIPKFLKEKEKTDNKYNNFEFSKGTDGFWFTVVNKGDQPFSIPFYYHPSELEDIVIDPNVRNKFFDVRANNGSIFITLDPDAGNNKVVIAGAEIAKITGERYGILNVPTRSAFIKEPSKATVNTETPILTCKNATSKRLVIWLVETQKNLVHSVDNCIIVEAKNYNESIRVADRLMYNLLGIMD